MNITTNQVAYLLQDIFICGWNDMQLKNEFRQYNNALVQLIYNYGRITSNGTIITECTEVQLTKIQIFVNAHFTQLDFTELFNN